MFFVEAIVAEDVAWAIVCILISTILIWSSRNCLYPSWRMLIGVGLFCIGVARLVFEQSPLLYFQHLPPLLTKILWIIAGFVCSAGLLLVIVTAGVALYVNVRLKDEEERKTQKNLKLLEREISDLNDRA